MPSMDELSPPRFVKREISPHLQRPSCRFVKIPKRTKKPYENFWQCVTIEDAQISWAEKKAEAEKNNEPYIVPKPTKITNYTYDDPIIQDHLSKGNNIGLLCGTGNVRVVDLDTQAAIDKYLPLLPKTLTEKTPNGGLHLYYEVVE